MAVDHNNPQSRDEEILIATIDGNEYDKPPQSRMEELLLELKETIEEGGGGGGTTNYNNLSNKPQINGHTLSGNSTGEDLDLVDAEDGKGLSTNDYDDTEKAAVAAATSAISAIKDGVDIDSFGDVETALSAIKDGSEIDSFGDVEVALIDKADASDLGTAAAKDSTNAVTSGSTDLVESGAVKDAIDAAVASAYHHAGTKTVAQLTHDLLIAANEGNVYNITDSGTTTSDFIEGIGKQIDAGDNVGICKVGDVYMFDLLSGLEDTSIFVQKSQTAGLLQNDGTVNTTIEGTVAGHTAAIATKQPITDNTLQTVDKTIPGAINEVKSGLTDFKQAISPNNTLNTYTGDLDDLVESGNYIATTATHKPTAEHWYNVSVFRSYHDSNSDIITQMAVGVNNPHDVSVYYRTYFNGWSDWIKKADSKQLQTTDIEVYFKDCTIVTSTSGLKYTNNITFDSNSVKALSISIKSWDSMPPITVVPVLVSNTQFAFYINGDDTQFIQASRMSVRVLYST